MRLRSSLGRLDRWVETRPRLALFVVAPLAVLALIVGGLAWTWHARSADLAQSAREQLARSEPGWRFEQLREPRLTNVHLDAKIIGGRWYVDAEPIDDQRPFDEAMQAEVAAFCDRTHLGCGVAWRGRILGR